MPANQYPYDPTGQAAANAIQDEVHAVDTSVDISVFPLHGPVYAEKMKVESLQAGAWVELEEQKDYVYSPLFLSVSASTRMDTITYILLVDKNHTQIRLNYQLVGQYEDDFLLQEITNKGAALDRKDLRSWLGVMGQTNFWEIIQRHPDLGEKGLLEVMVGQMDRMVKAMANPYTSNDNLGPKVTELLAIVNQLKEDMADFMSTKFTEKEVNAGAPEDIYVHMYGPAGILQVCFDADDGSAHTSTLINIVAGSSASHAEINTVKVGTVTVTFSSNVSNGRPVLRALSSKAGKFLTKPLSIK
ncbi:hypothetical protein [Vibrio phage vB_pir03]|nr:hypothetical protein [Vibrio phage vB_pir03]